MSQARLARESRARQHVGALCGIALALAMTLIVPGVQAQANSATPIRIGVISPLTGASADFGNSMKEGAALAVDQINSIGGVLGRPLQLVAEDDGGDAEKGKVATADLLDHQNVIATLAYCNTGVAVASLGMFEAKQQLLIVPCAQGTVITWRKPAAESTVFRVAPADVLNAEFLVAEMVDRRKLTRAAIIADKTGYGDGGVADITAG